MLQDAKPAAKGPRAVDPHTLLDLHTREAILSDALGSATTTDAEDFLNKLRARFDRCALVWLNPLCACILSVSCFYHCRTQAAVVQSVEKIMAALVLFISHDVHIPCMTAADHGSAAWASCAEACNLTFANVGGFLSSSVRQSGSWSLHTLRCGWLFAVC